MSQAERDPQVLVSATIGTSDKVLALPSDAARWGWVLVLGAAKLRHPQGRFASRAVLGACIGRYGRYVGAYLSAGLLHEGPALCEGCRAATPDVRPGEYVVHDWAKHQLSRTQRWRLERGLTSGHQAATNGLADDGGDIRETDREYDRDRGETSGKQSGNPRARDARPRARSLSLSQFPLSPDERARDGGRGPGEGGDPLDAVEAWLASRRCGIDPGGRPATELARLVDRHGADAVIAAMASLPPGLTDGRQYVYGAAKALAPIPDVRAPRGYERSAEEVERAIVR